MEIIVFNRRWVIKARVWVCVIVAMSLLLGLAYWQLKRAEEKIRLQSQLARQASTEPLAIDILQAFPLTEADGLPITGRARWLAPTIWLLDNQMIDGRIGYDVIIPVRLGRDTQPMLINLGWVAAPLDRAELPKVEPPQEFDVRGLLRTRLANFSLGQNIEDNKQWPMRMQRVDIGKLNEYMREPLYSGLIYQVQASPYKIHYQPIIVSPERHRAYAMQWALLAVAVFIVALVASSSSKNASSKNALNVAVGEKQTMPKLDQLDGESLTALKVDDLDKSKITHTKTAGVKLKTNRLKTQ